MWYGRSITIDKPLKVGIRPNTGMGLLTSQTRYSGGIADHIQHPERASSAEHIMHYIQRPTVNRLCEEPRSCLDGWTLRL